jgi:HD superfamily phosphohydrolase YqeK
MSKFDKILFIADFCEAGREFPIASEIREMAEKDWKEAYRRYCKKKYLSSSQGFLVYSFYLEGLE